MGNISSSQQRSLILSKMKSKEKAASAKRIFNAQKSGIFVLPTELLAYIFSFTLLNCPSPLPTNRLRPGEILSQVCHHFRQVIFGVPDAWTTIDFPLFWPSDMLLSYASTRIKRSNLSALCILVRDGSHAQYSPEVLTMFSSVFATVSNIESITFHVSRSEMKYIPREFTKALPCHPHSLTICYAEHQPVSQRFADIKDGVYRPPHSFRTGTLHQNTHIAALDSIHLIDVMLKWSELREGQLSCRSLKVQLRRPGMQPFRSPEDAMIPSDLIFQRCPRLERLTIEGNVMPVFTGIARTHPPPLKELHLLYLDSLDSFNAAYPDASLPHLTKFGTGIFEVHKLCQFLLKHPTISDLDLGQMRDSTSTHNLSLISEAYPQVTRLTIPPWAAKALVPLIEDHSPYPQYPSNQQIPTLFSSLDHLVIDGLRSLADFDNLIRTRLIISVKKEGDANYVSPKRLSTISMCYYPPREKIIPKDDWPPDPMYYDSRYGFSNRVKWQREILPAVPCSKDRLWKETVTCRRA
ncbi:hypothetical protein FRB91_002319 [Serendipita sp. 411]|nr:hypothetical protein FRC19_001805 [Serendipita sp. 401]KAG8844782.1 hypothetical protein FRB91_002319 [Serendipita sp. 411]